MARPKKSELVKRAERTQSAIAQADPHATAALMKMKQRLYKRAADDADFWYDAIRGMVADGTTRDDEPRVKLALAMLRSFIPEQRTFPIAPTAEKVGAPMIVNVTVAAGSELRRGTRAARDEAIEVRAEKQRVISQQPLNIPLPVGELIPGLAGG